MNQQMKSYIELFPDELWLEIFVYTAISDRYTGWWNLNARINAILRSVPIHIHIKPKNNDDNVDYENIMKTFSLQITNVKDELQCFDSKVKFKSIYLASLVNLRSLYLNQCNKQQLQQLNNLHSLTHLSLPSDGLSEQFLLESVMSEKGEKNFPNLRSIGRILYASEYGFDSSSMIVNSTIQHVDIVVISCKSTLNYIQQLSALNSINVSFLANGCTYFSSCEIQAKICQPNVNELHNKSWNKNSKLTLMSFMPYISHLRVNFHGYCDFNELAGLLQQCSILRWLHINIKYYPQSLDLTPIRHSSPFFGCLNFGKLNKETKKPMLTCQWSS